MYAYLESFFFLSLFRGRFINPGPFRREAVFFPHSSRILSEHTQIMDNDEFLLLLFSPPVGGRNRLTVRAFRLCGRLNRNTHVHYYIAYKINYGRMLLLLYLLLSSSHYIYTTDSHCPSAQSAIATSSRRRYMIFVGIDPFLSSKLYLLYNTIMHIYVCKMRIRVLCAARVLSTV